MLHCEKDHLSSAHQVEHEIVVHYEFAQVVSFREELAQFLGSGVRFRGFHRPGQERSTGFWESAECGSNVVEETVEKTMKCALAVRPEELFNGRQIGREVFSETRLLTGHDAI